MNPCPKPLAFLTLFLCTLLASCGSGLAPLPPLGIPQTNDVIFTGDSVTYLWGQLDPGFQSHTNWVSTGISGDTSLIVAQRYVHDVISKYPRTIHIIVGTNDLNSSGWRPCTEPKVGLIIHDYCSNLLYMVQTAQFYGIKVVIGTIPPWGCHDNPDCQPSTAIDQSSTRYTHTTELNDYLKAFTTRHNIPLIDYHAMLQDATSLHYAEGLTIDGVHPDFAGFAIMTPAVAAVVK